MNESATDKWGRRPFSMMNTQMSMWDIVKPFKLSLMTSNKGYGFMHEQRRTLMNKLIPCEPQCPKVVLTLPAVLAAKCHA
ncbi:hypothetical protein V6N11_041045 [Hibiscus sabdariffa]|uniref:Uncharacterized protein n=1 Tax=Hibiscus sabdariffa TaxID=183260 RepID=A0ABR2RJJ5_9ROSI